MHYIFELEKIDQKRLSESSEKTSKLHMLKTVIFLLKSQKQPLNLAKTANAFAMPIFFKNKSS